MTELEQKPLRLLVVDDEPLAVERLQVLLTRFDDAHLVGTASDGPEEHGRASQGRVDLAAGGGCRKTLSLVVVRVSPKQNHDVSGGPTTNHEMRPPVGPVLARVFNLLPCGLAA